MSQVTPEKAQGLDSQTFLTALAINAGILFVELAAFVILKHRLSRIYEPRTYLPPPEKRAVDLPGGPWKWLLAIVAVPTADVLHKNGMDAYMFLRFLRLLMILFASMTIITWAVLLPVDTAGIRHANFSDRLARLSWGNIPENANSRYAAHIVVVYLTTFLCLYLIRRELMHYTTTRQQFLISPSHASLAQARTILITNIPKTMCTEGELRRWAGFVPGGVQNIWIYRDTRHLNKDYNDRLEACEKLEKAAAQLVRYVVQKKHKMEKHQKKIDKKQRKAEEKLEGRKDVFELNKRKDDKGEVRVDEREYQEAADVMGEGRQSSSRDMDGSRRGRPSADTSKTVVAEEEKKVGRVSYDEDGTALKSPGPNGTMSSRPSHHRSVTNDLEAGRLPPSPTEAGQPLDAEDDDSLQPEKLFELYAPARKRPRHRLGFIGLVGQKVDTIEWCKDEIARLNKSIDEKRAVIAHADTMPKPLGSAFIQCNLQMGAHVLAQCVSYHQPLMMSNKWIEVAPKDVVWENIDDGAYETRFRYVTSWIGSFILIVLWFAPVAFVGTLSNVATLCEQVSWLCWIRDAPTPVPGIIQGILPPLFLAILFAILPLLLKGLAWYENIPRWSLISISVYKRYFLFLVIHGFLVVTLSSGITRTASDIIDNPTKAISQLASQLPGASIFFLTWTLTQGLTGAGSALLQIGALLGHFIKKWFLGRTPRQAYAVTFLMPKADFGLILPRISLLATIGLAYSVLSPVINGLAAVSFLLFFFAWKYLLTWVCDQPDESETGGKYFPLAINFLFVGLYIEQFCLAALFFFKTSDSIVFIVEGALMVVLMAVTLSMHLLYQRSFEPITQFIPMSLATKRLQERWEKQHKRRHPDHKSDTEEEEEEMDLFSRDRFKSVVRRRIQDPVKKMAKNVQKDIAKTADIDPLPPSDVDLNAKDNKAEATTSARAVTPDNNLLRPSSWATKASEKRPGSPTSSVSSVSTRSSRRQHPEFAPASPRPDAIGDDDDEKDFDEHGFDHPSTYAQQPWVWIPRDPFGLSALLVAEFRAAGVEASDEGATMDEVGTVEVNRSPPDEAWEGGHDA